VVVRALLIAGAFALLVLAFVPVAIGASRGVFSAMSMHGWIAMGLGVTFSLIVGCGLMGLVFYSSRKGFDDRAGDGL
jgi:hypothetical protein